MKRRLHEAYDQITMSPACAERIETMLKRQLASPGRRRYVRTARPGGSPWAAAAVVGLVLLISGLGAGLALRGTDRSVQVATAPAQETTQPQEATALFEAAGISFQYPADWVHSAYQGEDGGADAFSDPQTQGTVFTLRRSEAWLVDLTLDTEGYQRQIQQTWPDAVVLELEKTTLGGVEANRVEYVCSDGGASHLVTRYEAVTNAVGYVFEYFHIDVQETGLPQQVRALFDSVRFGDSDDGAAALAETFVSAYFSGDEQALRSCLAADFSGAIEVYPDDAAQVLQVQEIYVTEESASYSVTFLESDQADSYTYLVVELVNNGDGWGVSFYALEK